MQKTKLQSELNALMLVREKFIEVFNSQYETSNRLPIKLGLYDLDGDDSSQYLLFSAVGDLNGTITYTSHLKTYFDTSFCTMVTLAPKFAKNINSIAKQLTEKYNDELINHMYHTLGENLLTSEKEPFVFSNDQSESDEKTCYMQPWFCEKLNLKDPDVKHYNIQSAINSTQLFKLLETISDPKREYIQSIKNFCEEKETLSDDKSYGFLFESKILSECMQSYIDTYKKLKGFENNNK